MASLIDLFTGQTHTLSIALEQNNLLLTHIQQLVTALTSHTISRHRSFFHSIIPTFRSVLCFSAGIAAGAGCIIVLNSSMPFLDFCKERLTALVKTSHHTSTPFASQIDEVRRAHETLTHNMSVGFESQMDEIRSTENAFARERNQFRRHHSKLSPQNPYKVQIHEDELSDAEVWTELLGDMKSVSDLTK